MTYSPYCRKFWALLRDPHCFYCRAKLTQATGTMDHLIPRHRGGSNRSENLRLACSRCNQQKGHHLLSELHMFLYFRRLGFTEAPVAEPRGLKPESYASWVARGAPIGDGRLTPDARRDRGPDGAGHGASRARRGYSPGGVGAGVG